MIPRFKLIAVALGLAIAAGTIGDASAMTVVKSVRTHTLAGTRTAKVITHRPNRVVLPARIFRPARVVYRAPVLVRSPVVVKKVVRVVHRPGIVARRIVTKTIVR